MPQQPVTLDIFREAEEAFDNAESIEDVQMVFKKYYSKIGYRRLCRMFVHGHGADELWLAEVERVKKGDKDA